MDKNIIYNSFIRYKTALIVLLLGGSIVAASSLTSHIHLVNASTNEIYNDVVFSNYSYNGYTNPSGIVPTFSGGTLGNIRDNGLSFYVTFVTSMYGFSGSGASRSGIVDYGVNLTVYVVFTDGTTKTLRSVGRNSGPDGYSATSTMSSGGTFSAATSGKTPYAIRVSFSTSAYADQSHSQSLEQLLVPANQIPELTLSTSDEQILSEVSGNNTLDIDGFIKDNDAGDLVLVKYSIEGLVEHSNKVIR
ncbi:hypothetical protein ACFSCX_06235 [Bacillus salitolerans]|uniref:Cell surface protein n=1 Tax=Bacillus salitolerans TaxID=1437434 RepID=A0ABW4LLU4_9BACI